MSSRHAGDRSANGGAPAGRDDMLAFDLGGTWFRAGLVSTTGRVTVLERVPAAGRTTEGEPIEVLVGRLVDHLVGRAERFGVKSGTVAVSLGATMDMNTGIVLSSAPLWGAGECLVDLDAELSIRMPGVRWSVVNDVSALATQLASGYRGESGWMAALTVSSGIAYRLIDTRTGYIPRDPLYGLQGEIGHLPTEARWRGERLQLPCECGVPGHVSAFSSGPGILAVLRHLERAGELPFDDYLGPAGSADSSALERFAARAGAGEAFALEVLDTVSRPLAMVLLYQATLSPEVIRTVLSGGVVEALGRCYLDSLLRNLQSLGLYRVTSRDAGYFRRKILIGASDGHDALRGAARFARTRDGAGAR